MLRIDRGRLLSSVLINVVPETPLATTDSWDNQNINVSQQLAPAALLAPSSVGRLQGIRLQRRRAPQPLALLALPAAMPSACDCTLLVAAAAVSSEPTSHRCQVLQGHIATRMSRNTAVSDIVSEIIPLLVAYGLARIFTS